jgi:hypothetical protein
LLVEAKQFGAGNRGLRDGHSSHLDFSEHFFSLLRGPSLGVRILLFGRLRGLVDEALALG